MNRHYIALRGWATAIMVFWHTVVMITYLNPNWGFSIPTGWSSKVLSCISILGTFVVPIFLYISGSFFAYAARIYQKKFPIKFIWTNLYHLLRPYLFWSVVFYIMIYVTEDKIYPLITYIKDILVGYPFDFIPILVFWYLVSPIISRASKSKAVLLIIGIGLYQIILIILINPGIIGLIFPGWMKILIPKVIGTTLAQWGIYFPLGLFSSLYSDSFIPWLKKFKYLLILLLIILIVLSIADSLSLLIAPWWVYYVCPLLLLLIFPLIRRNQIPLFHFMEKVGVNSFPIYLTNLIILDVVLNLMRLTIPWILNLDLVLVLILFSITLSIPLFSVKGINWLRLRKPNIFRLGKDSTKPD